LKTGAEAAFFNANSIFTFPAKTLVKLLFPTRVTSHNVILLSLICGIVSGFFLSLTTYESMLAGAFFLLVKNILDKADGQLARARGSCTRYGRFLDSIVDFAVNAAVYTGLTAHVYRAEPAIRNLALGAGAFLFAMLQCSYFVYYQVSYVNRVKPLNMNRTDESITPEDLTELSASGAGRKTLFLQRVYLVIYGWQDVLFRGIDRAGFNRLQKRFPGVDCDRIWYRDRRFLSLASFLGLGVQIGALSLCVVADRVRAYLWYVWIPANAYLVVLIFYRNIMAHKRGIQLEQAKAGA